MTLRSESLSWLGICRSGVAGAHSGLKSHGTRIDTEGRHHMEVQSETFPKNTPAIFGPIVYAGRTPGSQPGKQGSSPCGVILEFGPIVQRENSSSAGMGQGFDSLWVHKGVPYANENTDPG